MRYADDCNIYVRSERAGQRVMESITGFITKRLKLKVNQAKSVVARPWKRKFLGFSFTSGREPRVRIAPEALAQCRERLRGLTRRTRTVGLEEMVTELSACLKGWQSYYGYCQTPSVLRDLDSWIRRRLRSVVCKQWKRGAAPVCGTTCARGNKGTRRSNGGQHPRPLAYKPQPGPQLRASLCLLRRARSSPADFLQPHNPPNRRVRTRTHGGVTGKACEGPTYVDFRGY